MDEPIDTSLTFYNYKEPMIEIPKSEGVGYYGCLMATKDGNMVQCHVCGKLCRDVGRHAQAAHKLYADEYKEKYQLAKTTALCSEQLRIQKRDTYMNWLNKQSEQERMEINERAVAALKEARRIGKEQGITNRGEHHRLETANKRGHCPDQLLDKIKQVNEKLGHAPSKAEFITEAGSRYWDLILLVFGSWKIALSKLNLVPQSNARKGVYRHYTDDQLLEYLRVFMNTNNRPPTYTDFLRRLMPDYLTYQRRFGGIRNARKLAGLPELVNQPTFLNG